LALSAVVAFPFIVFERDIFVLSTIVLSMASFQFPGGHVDFSFSLLSMLVSVMVLVLLMFSLTCLPHIIGLLFPFSLGNLESSYFFLIRLLSSMYFHVPSEIKFDLLFPLYPMVSSAASFMVMLKLSMVRAALY
jgi:hypothetical protein